MDTKDEGFHLTNLADGVYFKFFPLKPSVLISWTDNNYSNGFLVLDRNHNGKIDDGPELFGNETPQPPLANPNGYNALSIYDDPSNGGNNNGMIDPGDAIFNALRVWIDTNHNGISDPGELHSLTELGVADLSLHYRESRRVDQFGNQFRYTAKVDRNVNSARGRSFDVVLLVGLPAVPSAISAENAARHTDTVRSWAMPTPWRSDSLSNCNNLHLVSRR